jgi:hypothetical protein
MLPYHSLLASMASARLLATLWRMYPHTHTHTHVFNFVSQSAPCDCIAACFSACQIVDVYDEQRFQLFVIYIPYFVLLLALMSHRHRRLRMCIHTQTHTRTFPTFCPKECSETIAIGVHIAFTTTAPTILEVHVSQRTQHAPFPILPLVIKRGSAVTLETPFFQVAVVS